MTHKQAAETIAEWGGSTVAELGLRFDRVAVRLLDRLQRAAHAGPEADVSVVLTLTAPVRAPGKTVSGLEQEIGVLLRTGRAGDGRSVNLHGNRAELRLVGRASGGVCRLLGFVHNPSVDGARILALAEQWLQSAAEPDLADAS